MTGRTGLQPKLTTAKPDKQKKATLEIPRKKEMMESTNQNPIILISPIEPSFDSPSYSKSVAVE